MIRLEDYKCGSCGRIWEEVIVVEERHEPKCCDRLATKVYIRAPGVHYKPHFSHALNREVSTYKEEESSLAKEKNGAWIASKNEANMAYETDYFDGPVSVRKQTQAEIRKTAEKAMQQLTSTGQITVPS